ncbi:MAG: TolC family protein [Candidatus Syntrophosphaera sp.]|nr:TolC family protein [Candidatus Syntrophosphaera sp.]
MKRFTIILILLGAALLGAQDRGILSLEQAHELALHNNAAYQAKLAELEAAKWGKTSALSNFLPSLSLDGTLLYMDPAASYQAGGTTLKLNNDIRSFGLSLSQPLFLGGKIWQGYQMSRIALDMAQTGLEAQRLALFSEVDNLYLAVLQTQELLAISELDKRSAELNLQIARLKYDSGLLANADYLRFQSQLASKEVTLLQAQTALQLSQLSLRNYLGISYLPSVEDFDPIESDQSLQVLEDYDNADAAALTALALERGKAASTSLRLLDSSVELSRRAHMISKGSFLPTLMLIGSRKYEENGLDRYEFEASNQILLTASVPILPQLGNYADMKKAGFALKKARLEAITATDGILLATEASVLNLVSAAKQVRAARLSLDYSQQSYEQLQERFRLNLISAKDLLDAELMLSAARIAHSNAIYNYHKARISLMQSLGFTDAQELDSMILIGANK